MAAQVRHHPHQHKVILAPHIPFHTARHVTPRAGLFRAHTPP
uniref:Uncharacterized protein n=1 Tax=Siphoviridae sp. ct13O11 TaxID=2825303 RepID=A0A8S5UD72_9CAUD|nr:MAG TPA: hypothetical protein [Siphoviridae sp. ct13O11]